MGLTQRDSGSTIGDSTPQQVGGTTWSARVWQSLVEMHCWDALSGCVPKYHKLSIKPNKAEKPITELVSPGKDNVMQGVYTSHKWYTRDDHEIYRT